MIVDCPPSNCDVVAATVAIVAVVVGSGLLAVLLGPSMPALPVVVELLFRVLAVVSVMLFCVLAGTVSTSVPSVPAVVSVMLFCSLVGSVSPCEVSVDPRLDVDSKVAFSGSDLHKLVTLPRLVETAARTEYVNSEKKRLLLGVV